MKSRFAGFVLTLSILSTHPGEILHAQSAPVTVPGTAQATGEPAAGWKGFLRALVDVREWDLLRRNVPEGPKASITGASSSRKERKTPLNDVLKRIEAERVFAASV